MSDIRICLSDKNHGIMTYQSVVDKILARIRRFGRGHVCTPRDFVDLASRASVDQALSRLVRAGQLRRIGRGLYDYPKTSARLGVLAPSPKAVERALARRSGATLKSSAAQVANALGVSTQVPMRTVLETTGRSRTVTVQGRTMRLIHRAPSKLGRPSGVADDVIEAVERDTYPQAVGRPVGFTRSLHYALRSVGRTLGWNLLALPAYLALFTALGFDVKRLRRYQIGALQLKGIPLRAGKVLSTKDIESLFRNPRTPRAPFEAAARTVPPADEI